MQALVSLGARVEELVFESFSVSADRRSFSVVFRADDCSYHRTFFTSLSFTNTPKETLENLVFHIGLFCLMDLDQLLAPRPVVIKSGNLSPEQKQFYKDVRNLYARQLFFERKAPLSLLTNEIHSEGPTFSPYHGKLDVTKMVGSFGGGKESLLYKTILEQSGVKPLWFMKTRKPYEARLKAIVKSAGLKDHVIITEDASDLYKNQYLQSTGNYHSRTNTGISIYILFMTLIALEKSYANICLGNERSAEDGYCLWDGVVVNHQFDKTADYRKLMGEYIGRFIAPEVHLFSIFESFYEYRLAKLMRLAGRDVFSSMTSCNYLSDEQPWCHRCPKCAWSFAMLANAFGKEFAVTTVGKDLFQFPEIYLQILNSRVQKPFECIGERPEIWLILCECIEQGQSGPVLDIFKQEYFFAVRPYLEEYRSKYELTYDNKALPTFASQAIENFLEQLKDHSQKPKKLHRAG